MDAAQHFFTPARCGAWATGRLLGEHLLRFRRFAKGISPVMALDSGVEPDCQQAARRLRAGPAACEPAMDPWSAEHFGGVLKLIKLRVQPVSLLFAWTLAQVFKRSTHHRAQTTAPPTALGQRSPELDRVYFLQQQA
jgi:uncharacterized damage-inducible protein DinB